MIPTSDRTHHRLRIDRVVVVVVTHKTMEHEQRPRNAQAIKQKAENPSTLTQPILNALLLQKRFQRQYKLPTNRPLYQQKY